MFTSSSIIDNLNQAEGIEYKKLCRLLKITKKSDKDKLDISLKALEKLEIININENYELIGFYILHYYIFYPSLKLIIFFIFFFFFVDCE